ncbi:MAG: hypothetical protein MJ033_05595 [Victivallaceae bacterium]|nr:hypothetical protein [Victivallaceae bacterium]
MFHLRAFQMPPARFAPGYFWFLNDRLDDDRLIDQLTDMAQCGARSVCPHPIPKNFRASFYSTMEPEYLSDKFFQKIRLIADTCAKLKMNCYLYDEGGWPSGGACGKVYASNPEKFARRYLVPDGKGKYKVLIDAPGPANGAPYPDLLTPGVAEKFIELTHQRYFRYAGKHFGKSIYFAFTDEPAAPQHRIDKLPWTEDFFTEFQKRKGYDVEPLIPEMLRFSTLPEIVTALADYSDVVSQLFTERFLVPLRKWCREHRLLSGGHFNGEDEPQNALFHLHGNQLLRALRHLDMPGVDVIWRQLWQGVRLHPFPKFAASVAHQSGNRHVLGEVFGVYGAGITPGQMKFLTDYLALCGVNAFVIATYPFSTSGDKMQGERPLFGRCNPLWRHLKSYHDYTARISYLAAEGKPAADTALFFDTATLSEIGVTPHYDEQEKIADRLLQQQSDFDYVDSDALQAARVVRGAIRIGKMRYRRLVLPTAVKMDEKMRSAFAKLRKKGAEILSSDQTHKVPPTLEISPRDWRFRVSKRQLAGGDVLYMILNISGEKISARFQAEEKNSVAFCDAETGNLYQAGVNGAWQWDFEPYASAAFLVGNQANNAAPMPPSPGKVVKKFSGKWQLCPLRQTRASEKDYETELLAEAPQKVSLGDWRRSIGENFSGEAKYSKTFDGKDLDNAKFLDLGEVKYAAQVTLNGVDLGTRLFPPYVFPLKNALKKTRNHLEVTVINTLANAISGDEVWARWKKLPCENPYEARERFFEKESLASGLFGPVVLKDSRS